MGDKEEPTQAPTQFTFSAKPPLTARLNRYHHKLRSKAEGAGIDPSVVTMSDAVRQLVTIGLEAVE